MTKKYEGTWGKTYSTENKSINKKYLGTWGKEKPTNTGGLLGGVGYVAGKIGTGAASVFEGIGDVITATGYELAGNHKMAQYTYEKSEVGEWNRDLDEWYNPNGAMKFVGDVSGGIGQSAVYAASAFVPVPGLTTALIGVSGAGQGIAGATQKTGKLGASEYLYGAGSGIAEAAIEKYIGSSITAGKRLASKGAASAGLAGLSKTLAGTTARKGFFRTVISEAGGEAAEEFVSAFVDPILQKSTGVDPNASFSMSDAAYSALVGFASGGMMSGASVGLKNAMNYSGGRHVQLNGNADTLFKTAEVITNSLHVAEGQAAGDKGIHELINEMYNAQKAYDMLEDKHGAKAALYLGEIKSNLAQVQIRDYVNGVSADIEKEIKKTPSKAEEYANAFAWNKKSRIRRYDFFGAGGGI